MIRIFTFVDKRPDFIPLQIAGIQKFFPKNIEITIFNNTSSSELECRLSDALRQTNLTSHVYHLPDFVRRQNNPNAACSVPLNWAWQNVIAKYWEKGDGIVILDSDMFPVAPFDPVEFMGLSNMRGTYQKRGSAKYIWNGLMFFTGGSKEKWLELDFNYGNVEGNLTDVGGFTHHFIKKYNDRGIFVGNIHHTSHIHPDNKNMHCIPESLREFYDPEFRMEIYADCFLHYGRGSNWDNMPGDYHKRKTDFLKRAIFSALDNSNTFLPHGYIFSENEWEK